MRPIFLRSYIDLLSLLRSHLRSVSVEEVSKYAICNKYFTMHYRGIVRASKLFEATRSRVAKRRNRKINRIRLAFAKCTEFQYDLISPHLFLDLHKWLKMAKANFAKRIRHFKRRKLYRKRIKASIFDISKIIKLLSNKTASRSGYNVGTYISNDSVFKKLLNYLMRDGKRYISLRIVFRALSYIRQYYIVNPMNILYGVLHSTTQMFDYHLLQVGRWRFIQRPYFLSYEEARVRPMRYIFNQIQLIYNKYACRRGKPKEVSEEDRVPPHLQKVFKRWKRGRRGRYRGRAPVVYIGRTKYVLSKYTKKPRVRKNVMREDSKSNKTLNGNRAIAAADSKDNAIMPVDSETTKNQSLIEGDTTDEKKKVDDSDQFPELDRCKTSLDDDDENKDRYLKMYMCVGAALLRLYKNPQLITARVAAIASLCFENRKYMREDIFTILRSSRYKKRGVAYSRNVRLWNWSKQRFTRNVISRKAKRATKPVPLHLRKRFGR